MIVIPIKHEVGTKKRMKRNIGSNISETGSLSLQSRIPVDDPISFSHSEVGLLSSIRGFTHKMAYDYPYPTQNYRRRLDDPFYLDKVVTCVCVCG